MEDTDSNFLSIITGVIVALTTVSTVTQEVTTWFLDLSKSNGNRYFSSFPDNAIEHLTPCLNLNTFALVYYIFKPSKTLLLLFCAVKFFKICPYICPFLCVVFLPVSPSFHLEGFSFCQVLQFCFCFFVCFFVFTKDAFIFSIRVESFGVPNPSTGEFTGYPQLEGTWTSEDLLIWAWQLPCSVSQLLSSLFWKCRCPADRQSSPKWPAHLSAAPPPPRSWPCNFH